MSSTNDIRSSYTRRSFLSTTLVAAAGSSLLLLSDDTVAANKPHNQNCIPTMAALIPIRYPGWIRTAAITSRQAQTWNRRTFSISKGESPGALVSSVWAPTMKATAFRSAHQQPITDLCRENTLPGALRRQAHSLIYDSPCFRGRLPLKTRFTIFIPLFRLPGCIGWFQFLKGD